MAGSSATTSRSVIPVCDPEQEEFLGCHMTGNVNVRSNEEGIKIPGSVADSSDCHIPTKPGSEFGPMELQQVRYF